MRLEVLIVRETQVSVTSLARKGRGRGMLSDIVKKRSIRVPVAGFRPFVGGAHGEHAISNVVRDESLRVFVEGGVR